MIADRQKGEESFETKTIPGTTLPRLFLHRFMTAGEHLQNIPNIISSKGDACERRNFFTWALLGRAKL